jgi:hypothetical protein
VASRTYGIGDFLVGVRTNAPAFAGWLDGTLATYEVDEEADPYYSVLVGEADGSGNGNGSGSGNGKRMGRPFNVLYREGTAMVRDLGLAPVASGLLAELETFLFPERDDAVYLDAAVIDVAGVPVLVPGIFVPFLASMGRGLERAGIRVPLGRSVAVDPADGRVLPVRPVLDVPRGAVEEAAALAPGNGNGRRGRRLAADEPVTVEVVCSVGFAEEPVTAVTPGTAVYRLASHGLNLRRGGRAALEGLSRLVARARAVEIRTAGLDETVAGLKAAAAS